MKLPIPADTVKLSFLPLYQSCKQCVGQTTEKSDTLKYLCVTFDHSWPFKLHVDRTIIKCENGLATLKTIMANM